MPVPRPAAIPLHYNQRPIQQGEQKNEVRKRDKIGTGQDGVRIEWEGKAESK